MSDFQHTVTDQPSAKGCLLIVDGHAYAYRAFHAIPPLTAPDGTPTNAIFGFIKALSKLREALRPAYFVVVWDGGLAAERLVVLPEYKANRPSMPDNLRAQFGGMNAWLEASGLTWLQREGVEADDCIATLRKWWVGRGGEVVIASSDKDFMQLVSPRVGLVNPADQSYVVNFEEYVTRKTGVKPSQVVDWLSLIGDSVDNIAGVRGVGPKTATELLGQFGSVEEMYHRLAELKSERLRKALEAAEKEVRRNQALIRLQDDLPMDLHLEVIELRGRNTNRLTELYGWWGFKSLLSGEVANEAGQGMLL